jgi:hypothetical protein
MEVTTIGLDIAKRARLDSPGQLFPTILITAYHEEDRLCADERAGTTHRPSLSDKSAPCPLDHVNLEHGYVDFLPDSAEIRILP